MELSNLNSFFSNVLISSGTVNEWNNKTELITGYSRDEAIGQPLVSRFIVAELRDSVQRVMDNALQGNETSNYELEFRTKVSCPLYFECIQ